MVSIVISVPSENRSSTQAVSILNSHFRSLFIRVSSLNRNSGYVSHGDFMSIHNPICPLKTHKFRSSCGSNVLDHLAAHGTGFAGSQVAVVALLQIDAHFLGSLHLELVHGLPRLGNIQLVAVLHNVFSSFPFLSRFFLRSHSITAKSGEMSVILRKRWGRMEIEKKNF